MLSLPAPPSIVSWPAPPLMVSSPTPPSRLSSPMPGPISTPPSRAISIEATVGFTTSSCVAPSAPVKVIVRVPLLLITTSSAPCNVSVSAARSSFRSSSKSEENVERSTTSSTSSDVLSKSSTLIFLKSPRSSPDNKNSLEPAMKPPAMLSSETFASPRLFTMSLIRTRNGIRSFLPGGERAPRRMVRLRTCRRIGCDRRSGTRPLRLPRRSRMEGCRRVLGVA